METKVTNYANLPAPLAVWCLHNDYDADSRENLISTTSLLKPTRQILLGRKYKDNTKEIEVGNLIASSMGSSIHNGIEQSWLNKESTINSLNSLGYMNSEAIYDEVIFERRSELEINGYIISGKFDLVFSGRVCDIKTTSTWTYIYGSKDDDYVKQMSIYRLLNPELIKSDKAYIFYIFTDWSSTKAKQDSSYPQSQVISKEYTLMSVEDTRKFVEDKLSEVNKHEVSDTLPLCSNDDLWIEPTIYKFYKDSTKLSRATKNFEDKDEAYDMLKSNPKGTVIEYAGSAKRCNYCNYSHVCSQYDDLKLKGLIK